MKRRFFASLLCIMVAVGYIPQPAYGLTSDADTMNAPAGNDVQNTVQDTVQIGEKHYAGDSRSGGETDEVSMVTGVEPVSEATPIGDTAATESSSAKGGDAALAEAVLAEGEEADSGDVSSNDDGDSGDSPITDGDSGSSGSTAVKYRICFDANEADGGTAPGDIISPGNANVTIPDNTGDLTRAGCVFDGWCVSADGLGHTFGVGVSLTMEEIINVVPIDSDFTGILYARWIPENGEIKQLKFIGPSSFVYTPGEPLSFHIDAPISDFDSIWVDGEELPAMAAGGYANYEVTEGSTIITFSDMCLKLMKYGQHVIKIKFKGGEANTTVDIPDPGTGGGGGNSGGGNGPGGNGPGGNVPGGNGGSGGNAPGSPEDTYRNVDTVTGGDSPWDNVYSVADSGEDAEIVETGDASDMSGFAGWAVLMMLAGIGCMGLAARKKGE